MSPLASDSIPRSNRTVQLRRYQLAPGSYTEFTLWWAANMQPLRRNAGFDIDLAYGLPESEEFIWAVSAAGDETAFLALEARYLASDARAEVMRTLPAPALSMHVSFVEQIGAALSSGAEAPAAEESGA